MWQGKAAIFAARDRDVLEARVEPRQPDLVCPGRRGAEMKNAIRKLQRWAGRVGLARNQMFQCGSVVAYDVGTAIDDDLWCINFGVTQGMGIIPLPGRKLGRGERIFPPR